MATRAEPGQYLIANCASGRGDIIDAQLAADEGGIVAAVHGAIGEIADINSHEVHRNAAHHWTLFAGHDRGAARVLVASACGAQQPIGIAGGYDRDARVTSGGPGGAIADRLVASDRAYLQNTPGQ